MNKKIYYVYLHTFPHKPHPKFYVGITRFNPKKRWGKDGIGYKFHQKLMWNAIQKYGWDNIKHEVLFETTIREQAEQKEIEYIALYQSDKKEFGYNIKHGGYKSEKPSPKKDTFGEKNPQYGKHWWNNGIEQKYTKDELDETQWKKGKLPVTQSTRNKLKKANMGKKYWTDGKTNVISEDCPGEILEEELQNQTYKLTIRAKRCG